MTKPYLYILTLILVIASANTLAGSYVRAQDFGSAAAEVAPETAKDLFKSSKNYMEELFPKETEAVEGVVEIPEAVTPLQVVSEHQALVDSFSKSLAGKEYSAFLTRYFQQVNKMAKEHEDKTKDVIQEQLTNIQEQTTSNLYRKIFNQARFIMGR